MKVLVAGGSGFIGSTLVQRLIGLGHDVAVFDKRVNEAFREMTILGDVRDRNAVVQALRGRDAVVNLAAEHRDDVRPERLYREVNVGGARNIAAAAAENDVRTLVFTSSVALYGLDQPGATESAQIRPFNEYGASKAEAEGVLNEWAAADTRRSLVTLRPAVVFGEGNRGNVFNLIDQVRKGRFLMVGSGQNRKSMAYLHNIVDFIAEALHFGPGRHLFNFADKPDLTTNELITIIYEQLGKKRPGMQIPYPVGIVAGYTFDAIGRLTGRTFPISSVRIRKFCAETIVATDALQARKHESRFTIRDGLTRMIANLKEHGAEGWVDAEG